MKDEPRLQVVKELKN